MGRVSWKRMRPQPDIISALGEVGWGSDRKMTGAGGWGHGQQKSPQTERFQLGEILDGGACDRKTYENTRKLERPSNWLEVYGDPIEAVW